jgi:hypothetical protein
MYFCPNAEMLAMTNGNTNALDNAKISEISEKMRKISQDLGPESLILTKTNAYTSSIFTAGNKYGIKVFNLYLNNE